MYDSRQVVGVHEPATLANADRAVQTAACTRSCTLVTSLPGCNKYRSFYVRHTIEVQHVMRGTSPVMFVSNS